VAWCFPSRCLSEWGLQGQLGSRGIWCRRWDAGYKLQHLQWCCEWCRMLHSRPLNVSWCNVAVDSIVCQTVRLPNQQPGACQV
jgi:hypothetical protein